jgi:F0F1-type ATP synthase membrane subunit c/vacuolar-type H+-ATPase subunit K
MKAAFLQLRLIHGSFILSWFLFILLTVYIIHPVDKLTGMTVPLAVGVAALSSISVAQTLRQKLVIAPAEELARQPDNAALLQRWRSGNIVQFAFAESVTLFGLLLRLLGASWPVAAPFFGVGLLMLLLSAPRDPSRQF